MGGKRVLSICLVWVSSNVNYLHTTIIASVALGIAAADSLIAAEGSRFAHSDSNARYLHHIDLYDSDNRKITPESTLPYSSVKTCGRCHDYETISHGWHFNAFSADTEDGRPGEPWIWTDARTGTQLPLSYRDWQQGFDPRQIGITAFEMTNHFGGRIPGGGVAVAPAEPPAEANSADSGDTAASEPAVSRWVFSGSLEIDCMVCHAVSGKYDFNLRREQIEQQNYAWAATAGLRLGTVNGNVSKIKDDADPNDDATKEKLPQVSYDPANFSADGTVFMDLVRQPPNNSCYQCHSYRTVTAAGMEPRWVHDEDVHLRAAWFVPIAIETASIITSSAGFRGKSILAVNRSRRFPVRDVIRAGHDDETTSHDVLARAGRLGAPQPAHAGLPPVHFEKMTCTACHAGPVPRDQALGIMTSLRTTWAPRNIAAAANCLGLPAPFTLGKKTNRLPPSV